VISHGALEADGVRMTGPACASALRRVLESTTRRYRKSERFLFTLQRCGAFPARGFPGVYAMSCMQLTAFEGA
jgi:hypothetical protein